MIKAVVFDFFGVFCPDTSLEWLKKNPDFERLRSAHQAICDRSDRGELSREEFYAEEAKLTGKSFDEVKRGIDAEFQLDESMVDLARAIHKSYKTAVLSNTNTGWVEPYIAQCHIEDYFDELILSYQTGFVKPDREIFELTATKLQVAMSEMVFIDDRESNIKPAREFGIKGIVFKDAGTLTDELRSLGIQWES